MPQSAAVPTATQATYLDTGPGRHPVRARRIAPGGIVGVLRTLGRDSETGLAVTGTRDGHALVAWVERSRLYASRYGS